MPTAPVHRLKKTEIIWLSNHYCKHGHNFLVHYNCYLKETPHRQKVGFFDIETSGLKADFAIMSCYCIKEHGKRNILGRTLTKNELFKSLDKEIVKQCINDLLGFDRIIGYYSKRFDVPFLRTRAMVHKLEFPLFGSLIHDDIYFLIRNRFCLSRNRMENACRVLLGYTEKNYIQPMFWVRALQGDKKSLDYILDHCKRDVKGFGTAI